MRLPPNSIWYGNDESCFTLFQALEKVEFLQSQGPEAIKAAVIAAGGGRGADPFELPPIWQAHGDTAVVEINGSLIAGFAGFGRLFGALGYGDITNALAEIANDKNIKAVLLNIDSGGGAVDGLEDAGNTIRRLDAMKPVLSYTGGQMGSAAYWLGSSARKVAASKTAQVGSIGTIIMHMERSKHLKEIGFTPTIVRHGKFKALANPIEPLSEEGKAQLQGLADEAGAIFVEYVADRRGMTADAFQKTAGEGRVFMGRKALEVGLVDHITNMGDAINFAKTLDKSATQTHNSRNPGKGTQMKHLSKKTVLALAAGMALDKLGLAEPEANLAGVKLEGDALTLAQAEAAEVAAAMKTGIDAAVATATAPLTAEVTSLKAALATAEGNAATFKASSDSFQSQLKDSADLAAEGFKIMKASMSTMSVALGGAKDVGAALTGKELVAAHEALAAQFTAKFPSSAVAAVNVPETQTTTTEASAPNAHFLSLVRNAAQAK